MRLDSEIVVTGCETLRPKTLGDSLWSFPFSVPFFFYKPYGALGTA